MAETDEVRRFARLRTICEGAWELPEAEREPWLRRVCLDDDELVRDVKELLRRAGARGTLADLCDPDNGV